MKRPLKTMEKVNAAARPRIVAGARRHFLVHGFRQVTMDDLARELGMSKKTFYAHFSSKAELLKAVLVCKLDDAEAEIHRIADTSSTDVPAALQELLAAVQRHTTEIQPPFVRDMRREAPEMFQYVETRRRDIIQRYFGKVFNEARQTGLIRRDIPTHLVIEILLGAVQGLVNPVKMAELGLTPKIGFATIIKVVLHGVLTEKGKSHL